MAKARLAQEQTSFILLNKSPGQPLSLDIVAQWLILLKVLLFIAWIPFRSKAIVVCCISGQEGEAAGEAGEESITAAVTPKTC